MLRGLDYLRSANVMPDEPVVETIDLVASKRNTDGWWPLDTRYPGVMPIEMMRVRADRAAGTLYAPCGYSAGGTTSS